MPVHPRVCGELCCRRALSSSANGSSPRVRGTPGPFRRVLREQRFIPACAGNSWISRTTAPRPSGSSPRVRGTPDPAGFLAHLQRFIPACAGNSHPRLGGRRTLAVHPRVCGELSSAARNRFSPAGSSPRVRGTLWFKRHQMSFWRFIPACAGNSTAANVRRWRPPVHPRVCGELSAARSPPMASAGSSPRVRGTPPQLVGHAAQRRFIPACAGNSAQMPT